MKFALKSLAAAALIAAVSAASAAVVTGTVGQAVVVTDAASGRSAELKLLSGTGGLYFSNGTGDPINGTPTTSVGGLVGALNVGKVVLTPADGAIVTETILPIGSRVKTDTRAKVQIDAAVTALTAETTTGVFQSVQAFGGATQSADFIAGVLEGGTASITNLRIDLLNSRVYADVLGNAGTSYENRQNGLYLWDISNIQGPTTLAPSLLLGADPQAAMTAAGYTVLSNVNGLYTVQANNILSGLKVTTEGFNFFADALGLTPGSTGYTTLANVNNFAEGWGSMKSTLTFTVREVPEPSTYALMGLGLVGISLVARRRAK
ncbi:MAG TPA: PEP-CTERM sorting domain-containing protein [Aquabacterium sp.]|uniref:PEP-CTERM sorting domain-containing protein n=1 Tax=Aquabacterium sp. TaxID=1872578 RepID=UPI002E2FE378|nr:PEP-CTERM sorting domain-containing protein [Aquabacterium sp.]HEX5371116.1 PEP-CTERM sorting domain-containing protein [Aquabacterium sp.]